MWHKEAYAMLIIYLEMNWASEMQNAMQIREFAVRTVLKPSGQYWNHPDRIETIPDSIETVRTVLKPSGQFKRCPDSADVVQTIVKMSR